MLRCYLHHGHAIREIEPPNRKTHSFVGRAARKGRVPGNASCIHSRLLPVLRDLGLSGWSFARPRPTISAIRNVGVTDHLYRRAHTLRRMAQRRQGFGIVRPIAQASKTSPDPCRAPGTQRGHLRREITRTNPISQARCLNKATAFGQRAAVGWKRMVAMVCEHRLATYAD
jgi:hypothetical protein